MSLALLLSVGLGLGPATIEQDYFVYVAAESADEVYVVHFDGQHADIQSRVKVGYMPTEIEGPHGLTVEPGSMRSVMAVLSACHVLMCC